MPGALFLLRFQDTTARGDKRGRDFSTEKREIDNHGRQIPVRIYKPENGVQRVVLLVHGVHYGGYDEPRLVHFAKRLASLGYAVVTPEIADLKNYDIQPRALHDIEHAARWLLDASDLDLWIPKREKTLDLFGISFAGGLCLSAASRAAIGGRVGSVFSFGGHADLDQTMSYLVTGKLPDGKVLRPHVYGQAVLVRRYAEKLVPPDEVTELKSVLLKYLQERFKSVRADLDKLSSTSRTLVELCLKRRTDQLGPLLEPIVRGQTSPPSLSPSRLPPPSCPVFLLHGYVDNVIPPSQTLALRRWASRATRTRTLISDLITHVELGGDEEHANLLSFWNIVRFWTELLRSAGK